MPCPPRPPSSFLAPLALGALACALLWSIGLPEAGWLGFLVAAFVWPPVREALEERRRAADPDGGRWRTP